ncbi:FAD-binding oxidoreductase [Auraticoccus monumenti]|uniref:FAD/FMN-containing dehydrogenase n=1 Tax=Auraticoccus monumenti TaxID=675864 RepID=A0A1G6THT2_9ACTN|nr:FAD-dependent oxidoreductase [Auraticoccus monumenti]SDD28722.1 FAD/FMN-containing dehydrogenase [Auraticoccus monumenti]
MTTDPTTTDSTATDPTCTDPAATDLTATPTAADLSGLRRAVRGRVWLPGDAGFDEVRLPWNRAVRQPVRAVVEAADADDVAALVRYAAGVGVAITTQPNGHGASGRTADTILLRTGRLGDIHLDVDARRARIGAGVRSGHLQRATAEHGLTGLLGSSPVVSVTGVALGGGLSWFGRAQGWVADGVCALDVVDADGEQRTVTAASDPDLFWALRGGGGEHAVVTALEVRLHPAPEVFGGRVLWSGEHARAVVEAFRVATRTAPVQLTLWLDLLHLPSGEPLVAIDLTYLGAERDARAHLTALDPLPAPLSDTRRSMTVAELGPITGEPTEPAAGVSHAELLTEFDDAAVDALLASPITPMMSVQVRQLGGAFAQPSDTPHGPLLEPFAVYMFGAPGPRATAGDIAARQQALARSLPTSGRKPVTFLNPGEQLADALPAASVERLRRIKTERDPRRLLRSSFGA